MTSLNSYTAERRLEKTKVLVMGSPDRVQFDTVENIDAYLRPDDLLVFNDSATLPASFRIGATGDNDEFEMRLAAFASADAGDLSTWQAVLFSAGNWRQKTEERTQVCPVSVGQRLKIVKFEEAPSDAPHELMAQIFEVDRLQPRLVKIKFFGARAGRGADVAARASLATLIYHYGRPIQYSYHRDELKNWHVQTLLAQQPISVEAPSALYSLSWSHYLALAARHDCAFVTHGAGLSSTGDPVLDRRLPLREFYQIKSESAEMIRRARRQNRRVIAIGTSAARAIESAFATATALTSSGGHSGFTSLLLGPQHKFKIVNGLFTGFHEFDTSHFQIEQGFFDVDSLVKAHTEALRRGFIGHEFGDNVLLFNQRGLKPLQSA